MVRSSCQACSQEQPASLCDLLDLLHRSFLSHCLHPPGSSATGLPTAGSWLRLAGNTLSWLFSLLPAGSGHSDLQVGGGGQSGFSAGGSPVSGQGYGSTK